MIFLLKGFLLLVAAAFIGITVAVYLAPESTLNCMQRWAHWRAGLARMEIEVAGLRTVYLDGGKGEPLLLLHGFGGEKDSFTRVSRFLTHSYRLIIPDVPGFGESDKSPTISYRLDDMVERMHAFVARLGLKKISIGGNSMGGFIAAAYAAKYPQEVNSLWLLAPGGVSTAPPSELAIDLENNGGTLAVTSVDDFARLLGFVVSKPPRLPRPILEVLSKRAIANHELHNKIFEQITGSPPLEARVAGLATPTLIVWGQQDRVINVSAAEILHKMLPNSSVRIMPNVGHLPMVEDAKAASEDYLAFRASWKCGASGAVAGC